MIIPQGRYQNDFNLVDGSRRTFSLKPHDHRRQQLPVGVTERKADGRALFRCPQFGVAMVIVHYLPAR
jgi:hypothetical protein